MQKSPDTKKGAQERGRRGNSVVQRGFAIVLHRRLHRANVQHTVITYSKYSQPTCEESSFFLLVFFFVCFFLFLRISVSSLNHLLLLRILLRIPSVPQIIVTARLVSFSGPLPPAPQVEESEIKCARSCHFYPAHISEPWTALFCINEHFLIGLCHCPWGAAVGGESTHLCTCERGLIRPGWPPSSGGPLMKESSLKCYESRDLKGPGDRNKKVSQTVYQLSYTRIIPG